MELFCFCIAQVMVCPCCLYCFVVVLLDGLLPALKNGFLGLAHDLAFNIGGGARRQL